MKYLYVHLKKYIFTACVLLIAVSLLAPGAAADDGVDMRAAAAALRGGDPTRGALYFAASEDVPDDIRESGRILFEASGFAFWK